MIIDSNSTKTCSWCGDEKPLDSFYFVYKNKNTRRGQCKECRRLITRMQRDPDWRPPCTTCGALLERTYTGGRRLCDNCASKIYSVEEYRARGSRRLKLKLCRGCGGPKKRFNVGAYCPQCQEEWTGGSTTNNKNELASARDMFQKYGISLAQYNKMLDMHSGGCWLCGRKPKSRRLAIEHDHGPSKRVRGLVCHICNKLRIGVNTVETAQKVLDYLASDFDGRLI